MSDQSLGENGEIESFICTIFKVVGILRIQALQRVGDDTNVIATFPQGNMFTFVFETQ